MINIEKHLFYNVFYHPKLAFAWIGGSLEAHLLPIIKSAESSGLLSGISLLLSNRHYQKELRQ